MLMRHSFITFLFVTVFILLPGASYSQVALNGTVDIYPYVGLQPQLINNVSALEAVDKPLLRHVYMVDKNIVALTIDEKSVIYANLKPYVKKENDTIILGDYHDLSKILVRNGENIGYICGVNNNWLRPFNQITGKPLDVKEITPVNVALSSINDPAYDGTIHPIKIYRKTVPIRRTHVSQQQQFSLRHELFLVFQEDITPGNFYRLHLKDIGVKNNQVTFAFDDTRLRSEAIHVNLHGYTPEGPKTAFLSYWLGDGGALEYDDIDQFYVVDVSSDEVAFTGKVALKHKADQPEYIADGNSYNHNLTDVHVMDFTRLKASGTYRLVVPGIGCSFDFEIADDIWDQTAILLMKGFLHQRTGIEIGPPHTDYLRPRNMHPADEFTVHKCDADLFFNPPGSVDGGGQRSVFERIQASILTDTEVPEAWGGWMDAGDFDQRMSHLYSVRRMGYLYELNPSHFEELNLNIPESDNNIPDILDEGMWCLDIYRRTQGAYEKGGISWWVESIEHPRGGEPSWLHSLPTALIPPTPRACFHYAATAAQVSLAIQPYNDAISNQYLQSALDAIKWADNNPDAPDMFGRNPGEVIEAMAYGNLYRRTGVPTWHDRFLQAVQNVYPNGIEEDIQTGNAEIPVIYLLIENKETDLLLEQACEKALIKLADELVNGAQENTYSILKHPDERVNRMVLPHRVVLPLVMAHRLTNEKKYTDMLEQTMQYTMGANPMNRSYISGLGERWFIPYQHDWEADNMPVPSGIPNFGPTIQTEDRWGWTGGWAADMLEDAGLYPKPLLNWPYAEKCFNNAWIAPVNEFTVRYPMGDLLMLAGYMAQESD